MMDEFQRMDGWMDEFGRMDGWIDGWMDSER